MHTYGPKWTPIVLNKVTPVSVSARTKKKSIMQVSSACVCVCVPIITDETGVIWLKCNNTAQIQHNPSHPSNWPVQWQSGCNFPITASDLFSFKILWSQWKIRGARHQLPSLPNGEVGFFLRNEKENNNRTFHYEPWPKTRMGVRMCKVYCSAEVKLRCEVYLTWKVRGWWLVYFATDISSQEKWAVRKTRKWASWVEVTAETHADTNTLRAGEGHHVIKRATAKKQKKRATAIADVKF